MNLPIEKRQFGAEELLTGVPLHDAVQDAVNMRRKITIPWCLRQKRLWCILLLPLTYLISQAAMCFPSVTEAVYSRGIYPVFSFLFGFLTSLLPRSVSETMIFLLPVFFLVCLSRSIYRIIRKKSERKQLLLRLVSSVLCAVSCTIFAFTAFCGLNYSRETFAVSSGLAVTPSLAEELQELCIVLVAEANELRAQLPENAEGVMVSGFASIDEAAGFARSAYGKLAEQYPSLSGYTPRPKPVYFSNAMSYLNITGIYIPFFFEANVNVDVSTYSIPATMMHELSHFKGYMREEEANFIAYLACRESGNAEFAYSGTMLALQNSLNALYKSDPERYSQVAVLISDAVQRDRAANSAYWRQFEGPAAKVSTRVNDVYLKTNRQSEGVQSYGQMVDLLLADYRQNISR